jgi:hypothetical protein
MTQHVSIEAHEPAGLIAGPRMIRVSGEIVIVVDVVGFDAVDKSVYLFRVSH